VNRDRSVLTKLLLCFLHMSNEFYKAFTGTWYSLLWPVGELELPYGSRLPVLDVDKHHQHRYVKLHATWLTTVHGMKLPT